MAGTNTTPVNCAFRAAFDFFVRQADRTPTVRAEQYLPRDAIFVHTMQTISRIEGDFPARGGEVPSLRLFLIEAVRHSHNVGLEVAALHAFGNLVDNPNGKIFHVVRASIVEDLLNRAESVMGIVVHR